jgi:hypothetical protein
MAVGLASMLGCAGTAPVPRPMAIDVRGSAAVGGAEARPLVNGPIRLLHVNTDQRTTPRFSRVWVRGGNADCRNGTPLDWDGETELNVGRDELVCVAAAKPARFSWHGRSVSAAPEASVAVARAALGSDR